MVVHYPRTVWKICYAEHKETGKTYKKKKKKKIWGEEIQSGKFDLDINVQEGFLLHGVIPMSVEGHHKEISKR